MWEMKSRRRSKLRPYDSHANCVGVSITSESHRFFGDSARLIKRRSSTGIEGSSEEKGVNDKEREGGQQDAPRWLLAVIRGHVRQENISNPNPHAPSL